MIGTFPPATRSSLRGAAAILASASLLIWSLAFAPVASAHARLVDSDPKTGSALSEMPGQFRLIFNEAVDVGLSDVDLLASTGDALAVTEPAIDPADPLVLIVEREGAEPVAAGVYTLVWRVLSDVDGHVTSGTVPFSVGTGEAPAAASISNGESRPPWWQVLARWLELSGWVVLTGIVAFGAINFGVLQNRLAPGVRRAVVRHLRTAWFAGFTLALAGMVFGIWAQTLRVTGEASIALPDVTALGDVLAETDYGQGWIARLIIAVFLLLIVGLFPRLIRRWQWVLLTLLSVVALFTISRTGHAAGEPRRALAVAIDVVHMSSVSVWLGGLVALIVALWVIGRDGDANGAEPAARLVRNHSVTSLVVMAVIIATGVASASFHVGGFRSLRTEDYGVTLLTKQALLIVVLVAAAINLLVLRPRARLFLQAADLPGAWRQIRSIRFVATFEAGFASLILLATAILTTVAPADYPLTVNVAARALLVDDRAQAGDLELRMVADLRGDPSDRYTLTIADGAGAAPPDMQRVIVETTLLNAPEGDEGLGDRFDAERAGGSGAVYAFPATRLGLEGEWSLNFVVRRAGLEDVEATFHVDTTGTTPPAPRLVEDTWRLPEMTLAAWGFVALAVVMLIVGLAGLRRLTRLEPVASGVLLAMCVLIAVGFIISATRQTIPVSAGQELQNPVAYGDVSTRLGSDLYLANCLLCHGVDGRDADTENPVHSQGEAADLTDRSARKQTDGDLYTWISGGVPATEMQAFDEALSDEERWNLVNYIRWLQDQGS